MVADFQPYAGSKRRIVLSFDIGMTFSGVSYCYLDPGESPKICCVTRYAKIRSKCFRCSFLPRYPGQEQAAGSNKIPTVLLYDNDGKMRAAGAEADLDENAENVDSGEWNRVEWWASWWNVLSVISEYIKGSKYGCTQTRYHQSSNMLYPLLFPPERP